MLAARAIEDVIKVRGTKDLDEVILSTIAMAFSRPAFEVPLHCESPEEFRQALSDTQRAVRTGELLDRESRQVIRKAVGGWREVNDPDVRAALGRVDKALRNLRTQIEQRLKDQRIRQVNRYVDFVDMRFARYLEELRKACVDIMNEVLLGVGMPLVS